MVAALDDYPGDGGTHDCRAQRKEIHSGICDREHGGAQAGRIQLYPAVQGALDESGDRNRGQTGGRARRTWSHSAGGAGRESGESCASLKAESEGEGEGQGTGEEEGGRQEGDCEEVEQSLVDSR